MLRTSVSPNIIQAGYRINVIPSEAKATLDVRLLPDEDHDGVPRGVPQGRQRSGHRGAYVGRSATSGPAAPSRLDSEAFKRDRSGGDASTTTPSTLPTMSTGATDMAYLRAKGIQCYGIGPASTSRTGRRDSARTATRSGSSKRAAPLRPLPLGYRPAARGRMITPDTIA